MTMSTLFSQRGGARLTYFNLTWPFVVIKVSPEAIVLSIMGKKTIVVKDKIVALLRQNGVFSSGLRVDYMNEFGMDSFIFWSLNINRLLVALEEMGHEVGGQRD